MSMCKSVRATLLLIIASAVVSVPAMAQEPTNASPSTRVTSQTPPRDVDANLDTQLYLLVGTNQAVDDARIPAALEPVIKQLRTSLPFKNYRLVATLINRVKHDGQLNLNWIGGPLMASPSPATANITPTFNTFRINNVKLVTDSDGRQMVRMVGFGFGARIPIQTATLVAANAPAGPVINYENTGLNTDISMAEGEPVIVGTLNVGPSGEAIILVMSARRTSK
jgi:hypothetical protein